MEMHPQDLRHKPGVLRKTGREDWRVGVPAQGPQSTARKQKEGFSGSCPDLGPNLAFMGALSILPLSKESSAYLVTPFLSGDPPLFALQLLRS